MPEGADIALFRREKNAKEAAVLRYLRFGHGAVRRDGNRRRRGKFFAGLAESSGKNHIGKLRKKDDKQKEKKIRRVSE